MEKRQGDELAGYGAMLGAGQQAKFGGITDMLGTAGFAAQTGFGKGIDKGIGDFLNKEQEMGGFTDALNKG